jgi:hypothetical protein
MKQDVIPTFLAIKILPKRLRRHPMKTASTVEKLVIGKGIVQSDPREEGEDSILWLER